MTDAQTPIHDAHEREMADVAALLFASGATITLLSLVVPHWPGVNLRLAIGVAVGAYVAAIGLLVAVRVRRVPLSAFIVLGALAAILIAALVYAAGPAATPTYGLLYAYVAAFFFYYLPTRPAIAMVVFSALTFAVALWLIGAEAAIPEWIVVVGVTLVAAGIFGTLGRRSRGLWKREREAAERIREIEQTKTTLLQAVSHEFRTPLTSVAGYAELLKRHDLRLEADQREQILDRLQSNVQRLEGLLRDILDVDRLTRGALPLRAAPVDLGAVVRDVAENIDAEAHVLVVNTETVVVPVDRSKTERIVENLITNALKHTPGGTAVRVELTATDGGALLVVEDEGPGVPDGLKESLFEPFRHGPDALDAPQPGAGLGLALVARFVDLHGGRAWVEDASSGGARFCVLFPADRTGGVADEGARSRDG